MTPQEFKARRTNLGFSQSALAERLGVSKQTIINYERDGGEGPPPMAALAITALGGPSGPLGQIAVKGALMDFLVSVLTTRDADAAAATMAAYEDMFARVRPMGMAYDESMRRARVFAFERLIEALDEHGAPARRAPRPLDDALLEAIMRSSPAPAPANDRKNALVAALLGKPGDAAPSRGLGSLTYDPPTPPLPGGLSGLAAQKFKRTT